MRVIQIPQKSVSAARNAGALQASHPSLVFLDADTHVSRNAFTEILNHLKPNVVGTLKVYPTPKRFIGSIMFALKNFIIKNIPIELINITSVKTPSFKF